KAELEEPVEAGGNLAPGLVEAQDAVEHQERLVAVALDRAVDDADGVLGDDVLAAEQVVGPDDALGRAGEVLELEGGEAAVAVAGLLGVLEAHSGKHAC